MFTYLGGTILSISLFFVGVLIPAQDLKPSETLRGPARYSVEHLRVDRVDVVNTTAPPAIVFTHGDISWLSDLATRAGWPKNTHKLLGQIILRESGGCPNRRGGDMVDQKCNITGIAEKTHRSDTGLLQINGVNYDPTRNKFAPICLEMDICTQEPLLDPLTNLKAGKLLFDYWERAAGSGWIPWDSCNKTRTCDKP